MIQVVKMDYINTDMERLDEKDVRYRFVVDVARSKIDDQYICIFKCDSIFGLFFWFLCLLFTFTFPEI